MCRQVKGMNIENIIALVTACIYAERQVYLREKILICEFQWESLS